MHYRLGMKSKRRLFICTACLFFILLTGCGSKDYTRTSLEFEKSGSIILHIREAFDESLYDFNELCAMNEQEVNAYNSKNGTGQVVIKDSKLENGTVSIDIEYKEDDAYYDMNGRVLFYGSCSAARSAGYNLVGKVRSTSDGADLDQKTWKAMSEEKVVIVSEDIDVDMPADIIYIGDGVTLTGSETATAAEGALRYIISK